MSHGFILIGVSKWNVKNIIDFDDDIKNKIYDFIDDKNKLPKNKRSNLKLDMNCQQYLEKLYSQYGFKTIGNSIGMTYPVIRSLFLNYTDIECRTGYDVCLPSTKKFRSERVLGDKNPFYNWVENYPHLNNSRGIQGYFYKKNGDRVWLRSTWEYIYATWLEKNNILWSYETTSYSFSNGESYRPDFNILNGDMSLNHIVEVKGYFKNRLYKIDLMKREYPHIKISIVDRIDSYTENYNKDVKKWKKLRKLK